MGCTIRWLGAGFITRCLCWWLDEDEWCILPPWLRWTTGGWRDKREAQRYYTVVDYCYSKHDKAHSTCLVPHETICVVLNIWCCDGQQVAEVIKETHVVIDSRFKIQIYYTGIDYCYNKHGNAHQLVWSHMKQSVLCRTFDAAMNNRRLQG